MTYQDFTRVIIDSKVTDWLETNEGYIFIPDIDIMLKYDLVEGETMDHALPIKERFHGFIQASKWHILYHGSVIDSQEVVIVHNDNGVQAVTFAEGIALDEEFPITPLEYRICLLITEQMGPNSAEGFDDTLTAAKVVLRIE